MTKNIRISFTPNTPKYLSIADSLIKAIRDGDFHKGDKLPSINQLSIEHLISRDTVEKAYKELKEQNIIEAVRGKGYFVNRTDVNIPTRVLLIFNKLSNYKKQIYDALRLSLGKNTKVDLKIHHWDINILDIIIKNNIGRYDYYVVMPHFYDNEEKAINIINRIPREKLILLDRDLPQLEQNYTAIYQDFRKDIIDALEEAKPLLDKYQRLIYLNPTLTPYPPEIKAGFRNFCMLNSFDYSIFEEMNENSPVQKGDVYIVISETDLVELIKKCKDNHFKIGTDIGIISYNETPLKEILLEGITVISTDHKAMGRKTAELILDKKYTKIKNPFRLIKRASI
ncbi:MAG TPA: GntR family transcriptional regulator [Chitinophagaceae bacterium]|nr:GntR family transcriptional regulator [Chitinophagaceae bacterium]